MRQRLSLDGDWQFTVDPTRSLDPAALAGVELRTIQVPGPWQAQFPDLRDYTGLAWYRHSFRWREPERLVGEEAVYLLCFGAVDYFATVWLNGVLVGEHEGGYLPFEIPINAALRLDEDNELVVRVVDPGSDADTDLGYPFAEIPHGKQSWYGPIGGIWQSVFLERRSADHLRAVRVTPDVPGERATVQLMLSRPAPRAAACGSHPRRAGRRHPALLPPDPAGRRRGGAHGPGSRSRAVGHGDAAPLPAQHHAGRQGRVRPSTRGPTDSACAPSPHRPTGFCCSTAAASTCAARSIRITTPTGSTRLQRRRAGRAVRPREAHGPELPAHAHQDRRPALLRCGRPRRAADLDRAAELAEPDRRRQAPRARDPGRHGRARLEPPVDRDLDDHQRELGHRPGVNAEHRAWLVETTPI